MLLNDAGTCSRCVAPDPRSAGRDAGSDGMNEQVASTEFGLLSRSDDVSVESLPGRPAEPPCLAFANWHMADRFCCDAWRRNRGRPLRAVLSAVLRRMLPSGFVQRDMEGM